VAAFVLPRSRLFEIAVVLVRLDHDANCILDAEHGIV
jgi:hypothetical protein